MGKIDREKRIVTFMIRYYCKKMHHSELLCDSCTALTHYAVEKLKICPFQEKKTSCARCEIHCYSKAKRTDIRKVMSFVGPRMIYLMPMEYAKHIFGRERG